MQGQYTVERKIRDLPEGFEYQKNRFITGKNNSGCHVTYKSQDGTIKELKDWRTDIPVWYDIEDTIPVEVDFVPDSHRVLWTELQKLGKCFLEYLPYEGDWQVSYPENHNWMTKFDQSGNGDFNLVDRYGPTTAEAITNMIEEFRSCEIVHNGYRWFDCRDLTNFRKISDDEARKLQNEIAGT